MSTPVTLHAHMNNHSEGRCSGNSGIGSRGGSPIHAMEGESVKEKEEIDR
jgi:hypothetical protein